MSKKSKRSKATSITEKVRMNVLMRDRTRCIFCEMGYHNDECVDEAAKDIKDIMHYIPRSAGGLGIERNLAVGCRYHHSMYDNGNNGRHYEMKELFRHYLQSRYTDWNENELVYNKWSFLGGK